MSGKFALIIGNSEYTDPGLAQLTAPGRDVEDFARVLRDQEICAFDEVSILLNEPEYVVRGTIDEFFDQKSPDDMIVLYFSGHGVRDELGTLYLAVKNTIRTRLRSTAIKSDYIRDAMDQSRSRRQVVILDCCNSGAFPHGTKAEVGGAMGMVSALQGYGRFVLTASDTTQFAWEGNKIIGDTQNSLFTHFLVKGLEGEADSGGDGRITVDELYDYAFEQIRRLTPKQTPTKSISKQEGEIVLRQFKRVEDIKPVNLPDDLISEIEDLRPSVREWAVQRLEKILKGKNIGMARSAKAALEKITTDENTTRRVARAAIQVLQSTTLGGQLTVQRTEEYLANEKSEAELKAYRKEDHIAREETQAISTTPEKERPKDNRQIAPSTEATGRAVQEQRVRTQEMPRLIPFVIGTTLIFFLCLGGGWVAWRYVFLPMLSIPSETSTTSAPASVIPPVDHTPTPTLTMTPSPTEILPTFTSTPSATATVNSFSPKEPDQFIFFYFELIIYKRDYELAWSLSTSAYKGKNELKDFEDWKTTWEKVTDWERPDLTIEHITPTKAIVSTPEIWFEAKYRYSLKDIKYCLIRDENRNTWLFDDKANCGLSST